MCIVDDASTDGTDAVARGALSRSLRAPSVEWSVVFWSPEYLEQVIGVDRITASGALTFFFLAAVIGRFAGSRLTRRLKPVTLLIGAAALVVAAFPVFWLANSPALAFGAGLHIFVTGSSSRRRKRV